MKVAVIIAGGGIGKRMGSDRPKQYLELNGRPMICHTLDRFMGIEDIRKIVVVLPSDFAPSFQDDILKPYDYDLSFIEILEGGVKRQDSVRNGLMAVPDDFDVVLVHDACRPFITKDLIRRSIETAYGEGAAIIAAPIKETLKKVNGGAIDETVDRQHLWGAQTPQAFRLGILRKAIEKAYQDGFYGTDDAILVERLGGKVKIIEGDYRNIKITAPEDLIVAEAIAKTFTAETQSSQR